MPFSFHDKPKPSDKYRGKTRDEFLDGVRDKFDQEKKMFFEKGPSWESMPSTTAGFSRAGFFDDDMMPRGGGRGDIRSHLDDLAQRHPEFASQLRGPAWGSEMWAGDGEGAAASAGASNSDPRPEQEPCDEPGPLRGRQRSGNNGNNLRNTVPDMGQRRADELKEEARGQRSWSAPPDSRLPREQQRFVSRININPVNPEEGEPQAPDNQGKPPPVPKQQQSPPPPPQQPKSAGNVRHIPIFVEGRDEPILPKNVDADSEHSSQFTSQAQHQFHPQNKPFPQQKRPQNNPPPQHTKQPNRSFNTSPKPFQQPQPGMQQPTEERPKTPEAPAPCRASRVPNDPISRVQAIQKEVDALKEQVDKYSGSSRQEKEYVYLDEMLTRNLIKLDDIETEGKENVRVARKEAIRCIQQCIGLLEGKVPLPTEAADAGDREAEADSPPPAVAVELAVPSPMDVEPPKTDDDQQQPKD